MKICDEQETKKALEYGDLKEGDIFGFIRHGELSIAVRTGKGYSYLVDRNIVGRYINHSGEAGCIGADIIRYPNACIDLGDPE